MKYKKTKIFNNLFTRLIILHFWTIVLNWYSYIIPVSYDSVTITFLLPLKGNIKIPLQDANHVLLASRLVNRLNYHLHHWKASKSLPFKTLRPTPIINAITNWPYLTPAYWFETRDRVLLEQRKIFFFKLSHLN